MRGGSLLLPAILRSSPRPGRGSLGWRGWLLRLQWSRKSNLESYAEGSAGWCETGSAVRPWGRSPRAPACLWISCGGKCFCNLAGMTRLRVSRLTSFCSELLLGRLLRVLRVFSGLAAAAAAVGCASRWQVVRQPWYVLVVVMPSCQKKGTQTLGRQTSRAVRETARWAWPPSIAVAAVSGPTGCGLCPDRRPPKRVQNRRGCHLSKPGQAA